MVRDVALRAPRHEGLAFRRQSRPQPEGLPQAGVSKDGHTDTAGGSLRECDTPAICTHVQTRRLRRIPFFESMMPRNLRRQKMEGGFGRFGDRRLEKGAGLLARLVSVGQSGISVRGVGGNRACEM